MDDKQTKEEFYKVWVRTNSVIEKALLEWFPEMSSHVANAHAIAIQARLSHAGMSIEASPLADDAVAADVAPDPQPTFCPGDVVEMRSGGPPMTVTVASDDGRLAHCCWYDLTDRHVREGDFLAVVLKPYLIGGGSRFQRSLAAMPPEQREAIVEEMRQRLAATTVSRSEDALTESRVREIVREEMKLMTTSLSTVSVSSVTRSPDGRESGVEWTG